ncbi:barstar family protein [Streptomyces umbrinus]
MTEQGIHRSFAEVLQFPDYFGRSWDALVDSVSWIVRRSRSGLGSPT